MVTKKLSESFFLRAPKGREGVLVVGDLLSMHFVERVEFCKALKMKVSGVEVVERDAL